jgi:hypothetical protein
MNGTTTTRRTVSAEQVEEHAEYVKGMVDEAAAALATAIKATSDFVELLDNADLKHNHSIWEEARQIRDDLAGDSGSDFEIERSVRDARDLLELVRFAIKRTEADDV